MGRQMEGPGRVGDCTCACWGHDLNHWDKLVDLVSLGVLCSAVGGHGSPRGPSLGGGVSLPTASPSQQARSSPSLSFSREAGDLLREQL